MTEYRVLLGDVFGGPIHTELPASNVRFNIILNRPGSCSFDLPERYPAKVAGESARPSLTNLVQPAMSSVWIERDQQLVWSGIVWDVRTGSGKGYKVSCEGWLSYLSRRINKRSRGWQAGAFDNGYAASQTDILLIARDLMMNMQDPDLYGENANLNIGYYGINADGGYDDLAGDWIDRTTWSDTDYLGAPLGFFDLDSGKYTLTGETMDVQWPRHESRTYADLISELARNDNGFEIHQHQWYEDGAPAKQLQFWYPRKRRQLDAGLFYTPSGSNAVSYEYASSARQQGLYVDVLGNGSGSTTLIGSYSTEDADETSDGYPALDFVHSDKTLRFQSQVDDKARSKFKIHRRPLVSLTMTPNPENTNLSWVDYTIGDYVPVYIDDDILVDKNMRIIAIDVTLSESGSDTAKVSLTEVGLEDEGANLA